MHRHGGQRLGIIIMFIAGVIYTLGLQILMRPFARDGVYFQEWSSEDMMQTVSLKLLREDPLQTLLHIHIQPPAFDGLRLLLSAPWSAASDQEIVRRVDQSLYVLGAVLVGLLVSAAYGWLIEYGSVTAIVGSMALLLHPAVIFLATFLDTTLLTSVLVFCLYLALWRASNSHRVPIGFLSALALLLFFTRSIFQLAALLLIAASFYLVGMEARRVLTFGILAGLIAAGFLIKQQIMFGILSTSSFTGISLANSIGVGLGTAGYESYLAGREELVPAHSRMPAVLTSKTKPNGRPNFNHVLYLDLNRAMLAGFWGALRHSPPPYLARSYLENALLYFMPTAAYGNGHVIADRLPWTMAYNRIFSAPVLPILLLAAATNWALGIIRSRAFRRGIGLLLPGMYILAVCILADRGENMRFKFWLEPLMVVFLIAQLKAVAVRLRNLWSQARASA